MVYHLWQKSMQGKSIFWVGLLYNCYSRFYDFKTKIWWCWRFLISELTVMKNMLSLIILVISYFILCLNMLHAWLNQNTVIIWIAPERFSRITSASFLKGCLIVTFHMQIISFIFEAFHCFSFYLQNCFYYSISFCYVHVQVVSHQNCVCNSC